MATIVVLGALDTKGEEVRFLTRQIEEREHKVLVVDTGVLGQPAFSPDVTRDEVASAGGRRTCRCLEAFPVRAPGLVHVNVRVDEPRQHDVVPGVDHGYRAVTDVVRRGDASDRALEDVDRRWPRGRVDQDAGTAHHHRLAGARHRRPARRSR